MNEYDFVKNIFSPQLLDEIATASLPIPDCINTDGCNAQIFYIIPLNEADLASLTTVISNHVANTAYVTLAIQSQVTQLVGYLNNPNTAIANTARAVIVANIAPRLQPDLITSINSQIAAYLAGH